MKVLEDSVRLKKEVGTADFKLFVDSVNYEQKNLSLSKYNNLMDSLGLSIGIIQKYEEIDQERKSLSNDLQLSRIELVRLENNLKAHDFTISKKKTIAYFINITGILMIAFGFFCWFHYLQKYIDAEVQYKGQKILELLKESREKKKEDDKLVSEEGNKPES